jgi:hypothetical protein
MRIRSCKLVHSYNHPPMHKTLHDNYVVGMSAMSMDYD